MKMEGGRVTASATADPGCWGRGLSAHGRWHLSGAWKLATKIPCTPQSHCPLVPLSNSKPVSPAPPTKPPPRISRHLLSRQPGASGRAGHWSASPPLPAHPQSTSPSGRGRQREGQWCRVPQQQSPSEGPGQEGEGGTGQAEGRRGGCCGRWGRPAGRQAREALRQSGGEHGHWGSHPGHTRHPL